MTAEKTADGARRWRAWSLQRLGLALALAGCTVACLGAEPVAHPAHEPPAAYWQQLEALYPDWGRINADPKFRKWLEGPGHTLERGKVYSASYERDDAIGTARVYERWTMETTGTLPDMSRSELLRLGGVTFREACSGCHTTQAASRLIVGFAQRTRRKLGKELSWITEADEVNLFFGAEPDGRHLFPYRASFEMAGVATLLSQSAYGEGVRAVQPAIIELSRYVAKMAGTATNLDPMPLEAIGKQAR